MKTIFLLTLSLTFLNHEFDIGWNTNSIVRDSCKMPDSITLDCTNAFPIGPSGLGTHVFKVTPIGINEYEFRTINNKKHDTIEFILPINKQQICFLEINLWQLMRAQENYRSIRIDYRKRRNAIREDKFTIRLKTYSNKQIIIREKNRLKFEEFIDWDGLYGKERDTLLVFRKKKIKETYIWVNNVFTRLK